MLQELLRAQNLFIIRFRNVAFDKIMKLSYAQVQLAVHDGDQGPAKIIATLDPVRYAGTYFDFGTTVAGLVLEESMVLVATTETFRE